MSIIIVASLILDLIRLALGTSDFAVHVNNDRVGLNNTAIRLLQAGFWCIAGALVPEAVIRTRSWIAVEYLVVERRSQNAFKC